MSGSKDPSDAPAAAPRAPATEPAPVAPLVMGSPSLVDGVFGATGPVTITREHALSVLREMNGQVPWQVLNKLGRLFASPIAYLSDEDRRRLRQQVLNDMLENKRLLIARFRERLG